MIRMWMALAVLWACFALGILSTRFNLLRLRTLLLGGALLGITVLLRAVGRGWRPRRWSTPVAVLLGVQCVLIVLGALRYAPDARPFGVASLGLLTGVGWLVWIETRARPVTGGTTAVSERIATLLFAGCMLVSLSLVAGFWFADRGPLVGSIEEMLFRVQARVVAGDGALYEVEPELLGALRLPWIAYGDDTLVPQSAAAWPLLLGAAHRLGIEPWVGLILTLVNVALTAALARRLFGLRGGLLAAAFVAFNPIIARFGPTHLSHAATLTLLLCGTGLLLYALEDGPDDARRLPAEIGAGSLLGLAILMRPFGATVMAFSIVLWLHLRAGGGSAVPGRTLPRLAIGAVPLVAMFMLADGFSFGSPFRRTHAALFLDAVPLRNLNVLSASASEALKATWFSFGALGAFAAAGVLILSGVLPPLRTAWPFLLLPVLAVTLVGGSVGTYHVIVPFVALGFAWSVLELRQRDASLARAACVLTLAGALAVSTLLLYSLGRLDVLPARLHAAVEAGQARWGRLLVVVPIGTPEPVITRLWAYNVDGTRGDVVVALETNPVTNRQLLHRFADRQAVMLRPAADGEWRLDPVNVHEATGHPQNP